MSDLVFCPDCRTYHPKTASCLPAATAHPQGQSMLTHPLNQVILPPHAAPDGPAAAAATPARTNRRAANGMPATRHSARIRKSLAKRKPTIWHYLALGEDGVMERKSTQDRVLANAHRRYKGRKGKRKQGGEEGEGQEEQVEEQQQQQQQQEQQQEQQEQGGEDEEEEEEVEELGRGSDSVVIQRLTRSRNGWKKKAERLAAEVKRLEARLAELEKKQQ